MPQIALGYASDFRRLSVHGIPNPTLEGWRIRAGRSLHSIVPDLDRGDLMYGETRYRALIFDFRDNMGYRKARMITLGSD